MSSVARFSEPSMKVVWSGKGGGLTLPLMMPCRTWRSGSERGCRSRGCEPKTGPLRLTAGPRCRRCGDRRGVPATPARVARAPAARPGRAHRPQRRAERPSAPAPAPPGPAAGRGWRRQSGAWGTPPSRPFPAAGFLCDHDFLTGARGNGMCRPDEPWGIVLHAAVRRRVAFG